MTNQLDIIGAFPQSNCQKDGVDVQYLCITAVAIVSLMAIVWWETMVYVWNMKAGMAAENRELRRMLGELSNKLNNLPKYPNNNTPTTENVQCQLDSFKEKMEVSNKTFQIQLQKVIQDTAKMTQHISVLRDADSNLHKQYNDMVEKTDNHFVCVGMGSEEVKYTTDNRCPFYIDTNITHLMLNDHPINGKVGLGNIQSKVKYLVLNKILKHTRLQQFDITILINFSFKLDENTCLVENLMYYYRDRPQYIEIFQTAVKSILDKRIYILMPSNKEYSRNIITMCPLLAKHDYVREM